LRAKILGKSVILAGIRYWEQAPNIEINSHSHGGQVMIAHAVTIHIFVEITKTDRRELTFHEREVTGREIKTAAGVVLDNDLALKEHGKLVLITNDETVTIKDGEHFVVLPSGTIS
jgi:hypothetical protein